MRHPKKRVYLAEPPPILAPRVTKATLPAGVLNLVIGFQSPDQTILRLEWTVIAGNDKQGTPIIGTGAFASLEADCQSAKSGNDNQGLLIYATHQGTRGELPLIYATHCRLPHNQFPPTVPE
eukprot:7387696-Pyramimonas_sp.AAC.1